MNYFEKVDKLLECYEVISKDFKWEMSEIRYSTASNYVCKEITYSKKLVDEVIAVIKENCGAFSPYRTISSFMVASLVCQNYDDPVTQMKKILDDHHQLKDAGFKDNIFSPLANYILHKTVDEANFDVALRRSKEAHDIMRANHPFLTTGDDYPLAILLGNSAENIEKVMDDVEVIYNELINEKFGKVNGTQLLSHILKFSNESVAMSISRCVEMMDELKIHKIKIKSYPSHYGALGFMALLKNDSHRAVKDILEVMDYMKKTKKFKWLDKMSLFQIAATLVIDTIVKERNDNKYELDVLDLPIDLLIQAQQILSIQMVTMYTAVAGT